MRRDCIGEGRDSTSTEKHRGHCMHSTCMQRSCCRPRAFPQVWGPTCRQWLLPCGSLLQLYCRRRCNCSFGAPALCFRACLSCRDGRHRDCLWRLLLLLLLLLPSPTLLQSLLAHQQSPLLCHPAAPLASLGLTAHHTKASLLPLTRGPTETQAFNGRRTGGECLTVWTLQGRLPCFLLAPS